MFIDYSKLKKSLEYIIPISAVAACGYITYINGVENSIPTVIKIAIAQFLICELPHWEWRINA